MVNAMPVRGNPQDIRPYLGDETSHLDGLIPLYPQIYIYMLTGESYALVIDTRSIIGCSCNISRAAS